MMSTKPKTAILLIELAKNARSALPARTRRWRARIKPTPSALRVRNAQLVSTKPRLALRIPTQCASRARIVKTESTSIACARLTLIQCAKRAKFVRKDNTLSLLATEPKTPLAPLVRHLATVTTTKLKRALALKTASALPAQRVTLANMRLRLALPRTIAHAKRVRHATLEASSSLVAMRTATLCAKGAQSAARVAIKWSPVDPLLMPSANCAPSAIMTLTK